jgi:tetratricopeptide (TPR) repeat protein
MPFSQSPQPFSEPPKKPTPPLWQRHWNHAEQLFAQGEWKRAFNAYERAMENGADPYPCKLRMVELYRNAGYLEDAYKMAESAASSAPERLPAYEAMTALSLEMGDFHRAIAISHALIQRSPKHILAHNALGTAYVQLGEIDAAIRVSNTLIRLDPETAEHRFHKAALCQQKQEIPLAAYEFCQVLRIAPNSPHGEAALRALEDLDAYQIEQIYLLAQEDAIFRLKLERDPFPAIEERGFFLSDTGCSMLFDMSRHLPEIQNRPCPSRTYN